MRELLKELHDYNGVESCWAWHGKLFAKNLAGKIFTIKYGSDWKNDFPV